MQLSPPLVCTPKTSSVRPFNLAEALLTRCGLAGLSENLKLIVAGKQLRVGLLSLLGLTVTVVCNCTAHEIRSSSSSSVL